MNIILLFDKGILADMRNDMMKTTKLNAIGILDFCYIASNKLKRQLEANTSHFGPVDEKFLSTVLCQIFDSVDVDCRGYIDWYDFITYCLRSGSNRFRANSAQSNLEYILKLNFSPVLPIQRLCFIPAIQLLFVHGHLSEREQHHRRFATNRPQGFALLFHLDPQNTRSPFYRLV